MKKILIATFGILIVHLTYSQDTAPTLNTGNKSKIENDSIPESEDKGIAVIPNDDTTIQLEGRNLTTKPTFQKPIKKPGIVALIIYVNKSGKVTGAVVDMKKTNTTDSELWKLAKDAALKMTFNIDANAPISQRGSVTFTFTVN